MIKEKLAGTWKLISWETKDSDGNVSYPYGERPTGQIMYDLQGSMSASIMRWDRPKFALKDKFKGTDAELRSAFDGFESYFGTFVVDEEEKTVTHMVEGSLFPNLVGSGLKRFVEFSGNRLTLSTPPIVYGGSTIVAALVWERKHPAS